jgi:proline dehydrogenase
MVRTFFIYLSKVTWAQRIITNWRFAWRAASRFVAGETIEDAINITRGLNDRGFNVTLDHLGESTTAPEEALKATQIILEIIKRIYQARIRANVSIKLTQIGLAVDSNLCKSNLEKILDCGRRYGNFIRLDMEDTPYTEKTINLYRTMRKRGYENTGLVIQSYLFRSEADIRSLVADNTRIRLVKGAYKEPPDLAFPNKKNVDANYDLLARLMLEHVREENGSIVSSNGLFPPIPAIATHDVKRIESVKKELMILGLPKAAIEFQMLYGIRRDLQEKCIQEGFPVRIYVPYGTHWYAYFMRRLAERPANVWFFASNYFHK